MDIGVLEERLSQRDAIVCRGENSHLRVLDRFARIAIDVGLDEDRLLCDSIASQIEQLLAAQEDSSYEPKIRLSIDVDCDVLNRSGLCESLFALNEMLRPDVAPQITFHFDHSPPDWSTLFPVVRKVREFVGPVDRPQDLLIRLSGPFPSMPESDLTEMFNLGIVARYVIGAVSSQPEENGGSAGIVDKRALTAMAEYGYRVPIVWYVHAGNIGEILARLPNLLDLNYNSGFSLPLVCRNPFFSFSQEHPALPSAVDYCRLLADAYSNYSHYDDDFDPLNELAVVTKQCGWNRPLGLSTFVRLYLDGCGGIGVYKQSPELRVPWTDLDRLANPDPSELRRQFLEVVRCNFQWETNAYCGRCRWRGVCGGLDNPDDAKLTANDQEKDAMCSYRMLFLEHFANNRAADITI